MDEQQTGRGERKSQLSIQLPPALLAWVDLQPKSRSEVIEVALMQARGPLKARAEADSTAARIISFLGALSGMVFIAESDETEAMDMASGLRVRADPESPDGTYLEVSRDGLVWATVTGYRVIEAILVRHAEIRAVIDGTKAPKEYTRIQEHFSRKTGFY